MAGGSASIGIAIHATVGCGIAVVPGVFIVLIVESTIVGFHFPNEAGYVVLHAMPWIVSVNASARVLAAI